MMSRMITSNKTKGNINRGKTTITLSINNTTLEGQTGLTFQLESKNRVRNVNSRTKPRRSNNRRRKMTWRTKNRRRK